MGGQPKTKASSWSSAAVRRLWEEPPAEETEQKSGSIGILEQVAGRASIGEKHPCGMSKSGLHQSKSKAWRRSALPSAAPAASFVSRSTAAARSFAKVRTTSTK